MSPPPIPDDVADLVVRHIDSVEQLEGLLLLYRRRNESMTCEAVAAELRTPVASIHERLGPLADAGLIERSGDSCRYAPATPSLDRTVERLAEAYAQKRYSIIDLVFRKPLKNVQVFADAFRIRKDKDDA